MVNTLAFDLGASSGRAVVGQFDGQRLHTIDVHRFTNEPVYVHQHMHWDILRLLHEIKQGMINARLKGFADLQSIGIDTWAVDFGLLGKTGELLGNPYHYRDAQTQGMMERIDEIIPRSELFARTGIQFMQINTIFHLYALLQSNPQLLQQSETFLLIPELLRYFLTGERYSEWTVASTTQLCNPWQQTWDTELLRRLGLPLHPFLKPVPAGSSVGRLTPAVSAEVGLEQVQVIAVAEHDTASAVVAVPSTELNFAYLSCGTWSLIGTEIDKPIVTEQAQTLNVTNEGGVNGTVRLLKNVTGLWLIQECRRAWKNEGYTLSYDEEITLIQQAKPFQWFINPDHPQFLNPAHMPHQIQQYCRETNQTIPQTPGEILRCIVESLALRYRFVLEAIESLTQKTYTGLHAVGGGAQHPILCQFTANALARPVWAGPIEATAIGNLVMQYIALGQMRSVQEARQIIRKSFPIQTYEPQDTNSWNEAYQRFRQLPF